MLRVPHRDLASHEPEVPKRVLQYASAAVTAAVTATGTAAATKGRRVALSVCAARERQRLVRRRVCQPHLQAQRSTATCAPGWRQKPGECPRACVHARARSAAASDVEMKLCQAGADEMLRDNARSRAVGSAWRRSAPSHRRLEQRRRQASGACAPGRLTVRRPARRPHRDIRVLRCTRRQGAVLVCNLVLVCRAAVGAAGAKGAGAVPSQNGTARI